MTLQRQSFFPDYPEHEFVWLPSLCTHHSIYENLNEIKFLTKDDIIISQQPNQGVRVTLDI